MAEQRATALLGAGRWIEAVEQGEHLVEARPFSDQSWLLLTHANAGAGHRRDSLEVIQRARRALSEAGLEPCNELRVLEAALLAGERPGPTTDTGHYRDGPATPPPSPFAMGVPDLGTRFVGRQDEISAVVGALANSPIVYLVGLGGIGKIRLAIEAARLVAVETGAGVAFIDLGPAACLVERRVQGVVPVGVPVVAGERNGGEVGVADLAAFLVPVHVASGLDA